MADGWAARCCDAHDMPVDLGYAMIVPSMRSVKIPFVDRVPAFAMMRKQPNLSRNPNQFGWTGP